MKWKLYQLSSILNLFSIAGFFSLTVYILNLPSVTSDFNGIIIFSLIGIASTARNFIGLSYLRVIHSNGLFTGRHKTIYVFFGIIQTLAAVLIAYTIIRSANHFSELYLKYEFIFWFAILGIYSLSALILTTIDFFLLPALQKQKDPSSGILEDDPH